MGGVKTHHLEGNIKALEVTLSEEDISEINNAWPFALGFPHDMTSSNPHRHATSQEEFGFVRHPIANFDLVPPVQTISMAKHL